MSRICVNFQKNKKKYRKRDKYTVSYIQYSLIDLFGRSRISLLYLVHRMHHYSERVYLKQILEHFSPLIYKRFLFIYLFFFCETTKVLYLMAIMFTPSCYVTRLLLSKYKRQDYFFAQLLD